MAPAPPARCRPASTSRWEKNARLYTHTHKQKNHPQPSHRQPWPHPARARAEAAPDGKPTPVPTPPRDGIGPCRPRGAALASASQLM